VLFACYNERVIRVRRRHTCALTLLVVVEAALPELDFPS
jgi:hypothetical protein